MYRIHILRIARSLDQRSYKYYDISADSQQTTKKRRNSRGKKTSDLSPNKPDLPLLIGTSDPHDSSNLQPPTKQKKNPPPMAHNIVIDPFLQSVLQVSTQTRQQCMDLIDFSSANAVSATQQQQDPTENSTIHRDLTKQQRTLYAHLGELRSLNRNAILQVRETKHLTAEARQEIDRLHLHLQNLYYEERHLRGEIAGCESYELVGSFLLSIYLSIYYFFFVFGRGKGAYFPLLPRREMGGHICKIIDPLFMNNFF